MPRRIARAGRTNERPARKVGRSRDIEAQLEEIEKGGGNGALTLAPGATLNVSSLGKVFFPETGVTKGGLMRYYTRVWPFIERHVKDRPLVLKRYPDGVGGPLFFQQNAGTHVPDIVRVEKITTKEDGPKDRIIGGDLATLLYTVQLGAIEVHPWLSRCSDVSSADRCLIDLDPGDDVPFSGVVALAKEILRIADKCELPVAVKTSGASGIHLAIPLPPRTTYETSLRLAGLLSRAVSAQHPDLATVERSIKSRPAGTVYVDAMQNSRGKSMAAPYSARARADGTVSTPVSRRELTARLRIGTFSVRSVPARVMRIGEIWGEALGRAPTPRTVAKAIVALEEVVGTAPDDPSARTRKRSTVGGRSAGDGAGSRRAAKRT